MRSFLLTKSFTRYLTLLFATGASLALLLMMTGELRAEDFTYATNNGTITITGYTGAGGPVAIPSTINNLSVTCIESNAFRAITNISSVTIPDTVTNIGDYAFFQCSMLSGLDLGNVLVVVGNHAFAFSSSLTNLIIPDSVIRVGDGAFFYCGGLTNATLGNSVIVIGADAFNRCSDLTRVTIPNSVRIVGDGAFYGCAGLVGVSIGSGTTSIGHDAFSYCSSLVGVAIPNSVTNLGDSAFSACSSLTNVTIGSGVRNLRDTFDWCSNLPTITMPESITNLYTPFFACTSLTRVFFRGNAPAVNWTTLDGVTNRTIYYLPGTTGWSDSFGGFPSVLWNPQAQTNDASFGVKQNLFGFNIAGTSGIPLVVEASTNLLAQSWAPLQSCTLTNGLIYFSDPQWNDYPSRLYRIRSP